MLVPWHTLNMRHLTTTQCTSGAERKRRRLAEEEMGGDSERAFQAYREPMETVTLFKYMGRVLTSWDKDWPTGASNLMKDWKSWTRMTRILVWEG